MVRERRIENEINLKLQTIKTNFSNKKKLSGDGGGRTVVTSASMRQTEEAEDFIYDCLMYYWEMAGVI